MIIYVDGSALRPGDGTEKSPFKTISEAAAKALPGDEVLVAPGIYREAVDPRNARELPPNGSPTAPPKKVRPISRAANL